MKISYPEKNGKNDDLKFTNSYGKYLINHFNTWHGGVHIEGIDKSIQAIADGRIIAYRFMDDYEYLPKTDNITKNNDQTQQSENTDNQKEDNSYKYSNCFVFIQHDLELTKEVKEKKGTKKETTKEEKKYVTFYSVYNHLMPLSDFYKPNKDPDIKELRAGIEVPDQFKKITATVNSEEGYEGTKEKVKGLNARILNPSGKIYPLRDRYIDFVIPQGEIVKKYIDEEGKNEIVQTDYTRVIYTDRNKVTHNNIYINNKTKFVKDLGTEYRIEYAKDTGVFLNESNITEERKKEPKGARVRIATDSSSEIIKLIPKGQNIEILEKVKKHIGKDGKTYWWVKVKGYEDGYSHSSNFNITEGYDDSKIQKNKIVACDIPIKSGQHLGYTGSLQGELSNWYSAAQIDVFMVDGVEAFLKNEFGAGVDKKNYTILPEGTTLAKSITIDVDLPKKLAVKVVDVKGIYAKIQEDKKPITATIEKSLLGTYKDPAGSNNAYYTIPSDKFSLINRKYFKNKLSSASERLYWVSRAKRDSTNITRSEEEKLSENKEYVLYRKLQYRPKNDPQQYWVKLKDLFPVTEIKTKDKVVKEPVSLGVKTGSLIEYFTKEDCRHQEKTIQIEYSDTHTAVKGDHTTLSNKITTAYIAIPDKETDIDEELCQDAIVDLSKSKKVRQGNDKEWLQVSCSYIAGNHKETKKGWIESRKFNTFSAYNWRKFGFNTFDGGDEYMYDIKDLREASSTESKFIKTFWATINSTKDEILDVFELDAAYRTLETQIDIAKMVCKHKSEWSYKAQEIADEVTKFYDYLIEKEESSAKSDLEKLRDEKLEGIKGQVEKLMFWKEAAAIAYIPLPPEKKEEKKKTKLDFGNTDADRKEFGTPAAVTTPTTVATTTAPTETKKEAPKKPERIFPNTENIYHFHPIAFVNQMRMMFPQGGSADYCIAEMKVRAFLRLIKYKEGKPGEEGYRQIVGGGSFSDFSDHPRQSIYIKRLKVNSDAAGAYQFKSSSWDRFKDARVKLGFKAKDFSSLAQDYSALFYLQNVRSKADMEEYGQVESWGEIWVNKMIKKWKSEYPNITKKSFPKYKTRYADAHGDIIQHLIDKDLDRALRAAAPTWASFPDSIHGQEQSNYTLVDAKIEYRNLLLQEIKGKTDLHLEEGFLKKLGYKCCDNQTSAITGISPEGKESIDLRPTIPWHSQFTADTWGPYSHQSWMCYFTSRKILQEFVGLKAGGARGSGNTKVEGIELKSSTNVIQMALEENQTSINPIESNFQKGIDYLDQELEKGNPILVGVRHTYKEVEPNKKKRKDGVKYEQNYDNTTDHYVIMVGRGYENGKRYFLFYEVGTSYSDKGQHDNNRLYVNNDNTITGIPQHNLGRTYTLTQIRGNKTNGDFT